MKIFTTKTNYTKTAFAFLAVLFCLMMSQVGLAQVVVPYTTPGTYTFTVPTGVTSITVEAWGGGGSGGSRTSGTNAYGGGGGGGYSRSVISPVTAGQTYNLVVGGGSTTTADGEDSYFNNTSTVWARGGKSVPNNSQTGAAGAATGAGTFKYTGGNGSNASNSTYGGGGGGSSAGTAANGTAVINSVTGGTAPTGGGDGGNGNAGNGGGTDGEFPGGGGGGARRTSGNPTGGDGGDGQIIISFDVPAGYCGGYASAVTSFTGVTNTNSAVGAPDGSYASFTASGQQLVLDLINNGNLLNSGGTLGVTWAAENVSGSYRPVRVEVSSDNSNWTLVGNYTPNNTTFQTTNLTLTAATRYIRFTITGAASRDLRLDAVSFSTPCTPPISITTGTISPLTYCGGNTGVSGTAISVPFTGAGTFNAGNVYTAQLSNNGFTSFTSIGTLASSSSGTLSISGIIPANTIAGNNYRIRVISSNPSTTGSDNGSNITVNNPIAPTGSTPQTFCASTNPTVGDLTTTTGSGIQWYAASSGGSALASTTALANGTYYASQTVSGCEGSARLPVSVTVANPPTITTIGTVGELCYSASVQTTSLTYSATTNNPTSYSIAWTGIANQGNTAFSFATGGGTLTGITIPAGTAAGTYNGIMTISNGGCTATQAVSVTINALPAAPTGATGASECGSGSVTLSVADPGFGYTIDWYAASSGGSALVNGTATISFNTPSIATTTNYFAQTRNTTTGCVSASRMQVTATVNQLPAITTTGTATGVCLSAGAQTTSLVYTATANTPNSYSIDWNAAANTAGLADQGATAFTFIAGGGNLNTIAITAGTPAGTYSGTMTITNANGCTGTHSVSVTVSDLPTITTTGTVSAVCFSTTAQTTSLTYSASTSSPTSYSIAWTGIANQASTAYTFLAGGGTINNIAIPANAAVGTYTGIMTISNATGCTATQAVSVTINALPAAPTGATGASECGSGSVTISVTDPGFGYTIDWYAASSGGSALVNGTATISFNTPSIATTTNYFAQTRNTTTGCVSASRTQVTATVNQLPTINTTGTAAGVCLSAGAQTTSLTYTATTNSPNSYSIDWNAAANTAGLADQGATAFTFIAGGGNLNTIAITAGTLAGTYSGTMTITNANGCTATHSVSVTVNALPAAPTGVGAARCGTGTVTISASQSGAVIDWYAAATGGSALLSGNNNYTTPSISTPTTYYAESRIAATGCVSTTRTAVIATVNPTPTASAGADIVSCSVPITMTGATATGTYSAVGWSGGAALGSFSGTGTDPSTYVFTPSVGQGSFTATLTVTGSGSCTGTNPTSTRKITWGNAGSWLGVTSTNWFDATNWCGGIPTTTTDVTIPASAPNQPTIGVGGTAVCRNITNNGTLTITNAGTNTLDVYGDWTNNGTFTYNTSTLTFRGSSNNTLAGSAATTFYNLIVNKSATANTVTSTTKAFTVNSNLTVTQGDLVLQANDNDYSVIGNISVPVNGILTHDVDWNTYGKRLYVSGDIAIDGIFNYTVLRSTVNMIGSGTKNVRTGSNPASGFSIFLLNNGNFYANGTVKVNDNFWAMFGSAGNFYTNGQAVTAKQGLLINGGAVNVNGGTLTVTSGGVSVGAGLAGTMNIGSGTANVTGGMLVGNAAVGTVNLSGGTLTTDGLTIGTTTAAVYGTFAHSGGTANINGNLLINNTTNTSNYTCSNAPVINITGNWTNNETNAASFVAGSSQVNFNGTAASTIAGLSPTFYNLSIASAAGVSLSTNTNVSHTLNLANGLVTPTGANVLTVTSTGTAITGGSNSSYVNGKLAKIFGTNGAASYVFPVGKGGNYRPVTFAYTALSNQPSTITVEQIEGNIGTPPTPVTGFTARYWNITKSGGTSFSYNVTINDPGFTPVGPYVKILKKDVTSGVIMATDATTPTYTNTTAFTDFDGGNNGTSGFALAYDCSSTANAGSALDPICQGTTSLPLGGGISGTATGGMWSTTAGGTFNPNATTLNATWTPPPAYSGTATLVLSTTGGLCGDASDSKTQAVTPLPTGIDTIKEISGNAPNDNNICLGSSVTFSATAGYSSYIFKVDGMVQQTGSTHAYSTSSLAVGDHIITVDVSSSNCGVTFGPDVVHVYALTTPMLTADKPASCVGDTVTFTATPAGLTNYNFKVNGSSKQSSSSNIYKSATLNDGDTVTVDATNANGCVSSSSKVTITINPLPVVSPITGTTSVCVGSTTALSSSPTGGTWSSDNITVATVDASGVVTGVAAGTATISYKVTNGSGCSTTVTALVNVYALPTGTVTINENSGIANDSMICKGANVKFTSTATGTGYKFYLNGIGTPIQQGNINYINLTNLNNNDFITVQVTNGNNCTATFTSNKITVIDLPAGTLTASADTICKNDEVDFTATSGFTKYIFKRNGVTFQSGSDSLASYTGFSDGDTVTVVVTTTNGCTATFNTDTIHVNLLPTGSLIPVENSGVAANDSIICAGAKVVFTATPGYANYNFKLNGTTVQYSAANTYSDSTLADGDKVSVEVTSAFGCVASFNSATISVKPLPTVAAIMGEATSVCVGSTISFTDATTGGVWSSSNTSVATVDASGAVTGVAAGTDTIYYAVTDNTTGCANTVNQIITVNALPVVADIMGNQNICVGSTTTLSDETDGGVWSSGDNSIATVDPVGVVHGLSQGSVNIYYTVTDTNTGCSTTDTADVEVNDAPTIKPITSTTGSFEVCAESAIQLKDATPSGIWSSGNTDVATVSSTGLVTGVSQGTADIEYSITNTCGYSIAAHQSVIVHPSPTATITSSGTPVCIGGASPAITFTGDADSSAPYTFTYNINGSSNVVITTAAGDSAITISAPTGTAGTFTYNLVSVSNSFGCAKAITGESASVTINPLPTVYNVTGGGAYCNGGTGVTITLSGSQTGVTYQLYDGATAVGSPVNGTGGSLNFNNITGAGSYTIVATNTVTTCTNNMNGSVTVSISPLPTVYNVTGGGAYCNGGTGVTITLSGSQTGVTYQLYNGATAVGSPVNGTGGSLNFNNITGAGSYTIVATNTVTTCTNNMNGSVTVSISPLPTVYNVAGGGAYCNGGTGVTITLSGSQTGVTYQLYNGATTVGSPVNGTGGSLNFNNIIGAGSYTIVATNTTTTCTSNMNGSVMVSINPLPTATISGPANVCKNASPAPVITFTGSNGTAPYTFTYTVTGTPGNQTATSTGSTATVNIPTGTVTSYTYTLVSVKDNSTTMCSQNITGQSVMVTVNDIPTITLLPYNSSMCISDVQSLTATSTGTPTTQTLNVPSGTINLTIPDATQNRRGVITPGDVNTLLTTSGIPANATITNISIKLNVTHTYDGDLIFNLKAPNGKVLNLINQDGGSDNNFRNTVITMVGGVTIPSTGAPYTGTYNPDAVRNVGTPTQSAGVTGFSNLIGTPNGTWTLYAEDAGPGDEGDIDNWSVIIDYQVPVSNPVTWSPLTDLYSDANATVPYTGQALTTVYLNPNTSGPKTYSATATNASNCTATAQANINVNAPPVVTISANYCAVPGQVVLTASASGVTYKWSNGKTTDTIHVDEAGDYSITVTSTTTGCKGYATINVAKELVTNGDFSAGNTGFTSDYTYVPDIPSYNGELVPDGADSGYSISTSGQNVHNNFWGYDHTTGDGTQNYMLVNGHLTNTHNFYDTLVVWKETVNVLPGTTYYFSAWAMSLNAVGPFAQLKFSVNDSLVGTTAVLASGTNSNSNKGWVRFYGTWTAPANITSASIYINDLQPSQNGNDFGLDDISFATLSTFVTLDPSSGSDAQTICVNTPLIPIIYNYGNGNSHPKVTGLPAGIDTTFSGDKLTISGTPTVAGNYTYSVTTTGCSPFTVTGTITVNQQKLTLTSGNASPTVCINQAIGNIVYTAANTDGTAVTNVIVKGLPHGITAGTYNTGTKTITISGASDTAGIFKDTVITVGSCKADTAYGTVTVQNQTIALSSNNSKQTVCINTPIVNVEYALGGTATGASITAGSLPTGVTGKISGTSSYIISGTPKDTGTFIVTISTSGATCPPVATIKDTIVVNADAIITLTSAPGSDNQTVCKNSSVNITYAIGGSGNSASISWSPSAPAGIIYGYAAGVYTISGVPSATGVFDYTITATGTCGATNVSGTLTVQSSTIDLTSGSASPTVCLGSTLTPIVFTTGGNVTGASITNWSPTTPADISGTYSNGTFTISSNGNPLTQLGTFTYTITTSGGCAPDTSVSGTITVNNGTVGGTLPPSVSACSGVGGILSLMGSTGTIKQWESSTDGGMNWTNIGNPNTTTLAYNITVPTRYRVLVKSGSCTALYSSVAYVAIHNYWIGVTSTNWNTATNWSDSMMASTSCSMVTIPTGTTYKPQLTSNVTIPGINIASGTNLDLNGHNLTVNGVFGGTGTLTGSAASGLIINTPGNAGTIYFDQTMDNNTNVLKTFTLNAGATGSLGNALNITAGTGGTFGSTAGTLTANGTLNAGDNLTIKSNEFGDAVVGNSSGMIIGNVTVERYFPKIRSWRFVTAPVNSGQTINAAWQEGQANPGYFPNDATDLVPGYGTEITYFNNTALGYDANLTTNPSIRYWSPAANDYLPLPSGTGTSTTNINAYPGYYLFVRGSRDINLALGVSAGMDPTALRAKGILAENSVYPNHQSGNAVKVTSSGTTANGQYFMVGNPYASPIDLTKVINGSRTDDGYVHNEFYVWDPTIAGDMNVGGYVTYFNGVWAPYGGSYPGGNGNLPIIQSGQAFLMKLDPSHSSASLEFQQGDKYSSETQVFGLQQQNQPTVFYTNLLTSSGGLMDGVAGAFTRDNAVDTVKKSASKKWNATPSIGLYRNNAWNSIEFRPTPVLTDTLFYYLNALSAQAYALKIITQNVSADFPQAWLVDKYLNTKTPVTPGTDLLYNFTAGSDVNTFRNRFMLVFKRILIATPIPVTRVANQANPGTTGSANSMAGQKGNVSVHPNPVATGEKVTLQFTGMTEGRYQVTVTNTLGKALTEKTIVHDGGSSIYLLETGAGWAAGSYFVKITNENGFSQVTKLIISK